MSVQFEESSLQHSINSSNPQKNGKLTLFLIDKGIVKNEKQANSLLIGISALFLILALIIPFL